MILLIVEIDGFGVFGKLNKYDNFFWLSFLANIVQLVNFDMNLKETTNDVIIDKLEKETNLYLRKIIKQNETIINLLKED